MIKLYLITTTIFELKESLPFLKMKFFKDCLYKLNNYLTLLTEVLHIYKKVIILY